MNKLQLKKTPEGWRHILNGKPVLTGTTLEVRVREQWLRGRYEWDYAPKCPASFFIGDEKIRIFIEVDVFRWPQ